MAEVKAKLSALLMEVARGEEISIALNGRIVARLMPARAAMAADVFRPFWKDQNIDLEAPGDLPPEPVRSVDRPDFKE